MKSRRTTAYAEPRSHQTGQKPEAQKSVLGKTTLSQCSVAIVEPTFSLNVGYLARAMANFGLKQLYIVSSRTDLIDKNESSKFASHGDYIIRGMKYIGNIDKLRNAFPMLIGTTAIEGKRKSNITRKTMRIAEAINRIEDWLERSAVKKYPKGICFVFGRDTTGLTNEELRKCDYNITIDTGTFYKTLNISHAAAVIFYEFHSHLRKRGYSASKEFRDSAAATRTERERVVQLFTELAGLSDFQHYKRQKLSETLTRLLDRSNPSMRELYLLMGLASKAKSKIKSHQLQN